MTPVFGSRGRCHPTSFLSLISKDLILNNSLTVAAITNVSRMPKSNLQIDQCIKYLGLLCNQYFLALPMIFADHRGDSVAMVLYCWAHWKFGFNDQDHELDNGGEDKHIPACTGRKLPERTTLSWQNISGYTLAAKFKFHALSVHFASGFRCFEQRSRPYRVGVLGLKW